MIVEKEKINMKKGNGIALLPIGVFLVLYLGLGILFEYVLKIPMGFYNVPIVVAFLAAILVACVQNRKVNFDKKLELMAQGVGDKNIITMLLIFLTAGCFVGVVGRSSAESVAYFMLALIPARFSVAVLFVVACFVSVAMGTSVGTITLLTPIAVAVSGFRLCPILLDDFAFAIYGRLRDGMPDSNGFLFEVDRVPLQANRFTSAQSVKCAEDNAKLYGVALYHLKKTV